MRLERRAVFAWLQTMPPEQQIGRVVPRECPLAQYLQTLTGVSWTVGSFSAASRKSGRRRRLSPWARAFVRRINLLGIGTAVTAGDALSALKEQS